MGCDIHVYMEAKFNGKWVYFGKLAKGRNYALFGCLAGVRGNSTEFGGQAYDPFRSWEECFEWARATKASAQMLAEIKAWDVDAHTHFETNFEDLCAFVKRWKAYERRLNTENKKKSWAVHTDKSVDIWKKCMGEVLKTAEDARLIIWFDN